MKTSSALPLYIQLSEFLAREIAAGHLLDGEKLPPERNMAIQLGTSVGTLRKALDELVDQGLLRRRHGSGNYVCKNAGARSLYAFSRVELLRGGGLPNASLLSVDRIPKPTGLVDLGPSDECHRIRRLRYLNEIPCVLEEIWLDGSRVKRIAPREVSGSLYLFYRERLDLWIEHIKDTVSIAEVPDWKPDVFNPPIGAITGYFERTGFTREDEPVEHSRSWFDTASARYVARVR